MDDSSHFSVYFLQATSFHPSLLLPNLRVLVWHGEHDLHPGVLSIRRLLSPSLVTLNITLTESTDWIFRSFLANYPFICPNLNTICIRLAERGNVSRTTTEILSRAITYHEHIKHVYISIPIDDVALAHLAISPKPKNVSLVLQDEHQVCIPSDVTPFRNVEKLRLEVQDLDFVTTLLCPQDQMFQCIALSVRSRPTVEAVSSFIATLASDQRIHSLHSIDLFTSFHPTCRSPFFPFNSQQIMQDHISLDKFRPLAPLCHLRQLRVDLGYWFSINDDDLISLVRNWPSLQSLDLNCGQRHVARSPWRWAKYVTFKGLLSLIECCPDLESLSLPLDARQVPVDTGNVVCHPDLWLEFSESPIHSDTSSVGSLLVRHFPSVTEVSTPFNRPEGGTDPDPEIDEFITLWEEVNEYLATIIYLREKGYSV